MHINWLHTSQTKIAPQIIFAIHTYGINLCTRQSVKDTQSIHCALVRKQNPNTLLFIEYFNESAVTQYG